MFRVVEMPTARVLVEVSSHQEALDYISNLESSPEYEELLLTYGSTRRAQQELTIEEVI
jgi:hypothetical protein